MIFQHARFQIWNQNQHPFKHDLSDFGYSNDALPGVSDMQSAMNYIVAVLYPQTKPNVATVGDLPSMGNTINDFRVVDDDGDGKAAAYRWEQREGEASPSWHKIYDMDWGVDSILQGFLLKTQDIYVKQRGYDDLDSTGTPVAGTLAGQSVYGGASANTNLTFFANSGDGVGPSTGFVQFGDNVRPTANNTWSFGTTSERWLKGWFTEGQFGTMNILGGSITDSSGAISFDNENLTTTGFVRVGNASQLTINAGSITDSSGAISFGDENLTTTGFITTSHVVANTAPSTFFAGTTVADFTFTNGNIASTSLAVSFNALNLSTTGTFSAGNSTFTRADTDNVRIDGNTISILNVDGNLNLVANGLGVVDVQSAMTTLGQTVTGVLGVTGQINVDNLRFDGNTISTTNANGDLLIVPNGSGLTSFATGIFPATDSTLDIGKTGNVWNKLWLDGSIGDGTTEITSATLQSLRDINVGVGSGFSLFWDGSKWVASLPDTEITHNTLSGLTTGDAGHTQFALLAGRSGGQSLIGGTGAGEHLTFESTSHGTKGQIKFKDTLHANTDASFSGSWSGTDVGGSSNRFRHVYTAGEFFGLRVENVGALPSSSAQNVGRLVFLTTDTSVYVDTGTTLKKVGGNKFQSDTVWNGSDTTKNVTVSSTIQDARTAIWALHDNTNDFERMYVSIKATSASDVLITVGTPLPAGSYRLIGLE